MESLRKEIQDEMKRTRLDKDRLYDLLLKIVDIGAIQGPAGPAGECKCAKVEAPVKKTTTTKKPKTTV